MWEHIRIDHKTLHKCPRRSQKLRLTCVKKLSNKWSVGQQFVSVKLRELSACTQDSLQTSSDILAIKQSEAKNMLVSIKSGIPPVKHQRPKVDLRFLLKLKQTSSEVSIAQLRRIMRVIAPVVQVPPISSYYEERQALLGDLFEIKQVEFEGAVTEKLGRRKIITPVAYCNSPVELFKRWMGEEKLEEIQNSGSLIPVKIGCDGVQGLNGPPNSWRCRQIQSVT